MARSDNTVKAIPGNQKHTTTFTSGDYYSEGSAKQMVMKRETGRMPWMGKRKEEQRVQHSAHVSQSSQTLLRRIRIYRFESQQAAPASTTSGTCSYTAAFCEPQSVSGMLCTLSTLQVAGASCTAPSTFSPLEDTCYDFLHL